VIHGRAIYPAAAYLEAGAEAFDRALNDSLTEGGDSSSSPLSAALCVSAMPQPLVLPSGAPTDQSGQSGRSGGSEPSVTMRVSVSRASGQLRIESFTNTGVRRLHLVGRCRLATE